MSVVCLCLCFLKRGEYSSAHTLSLLNICEHNNIKIGRRENQILLSDFISETSAAFYILISRISQSHSPLNKDCVLQNCLRSVAIWFNKHQVSLLFFVSDQTLSDSIPASHLPILFLSLNMNLNVIKCFAAFCVSEAILN